MDSDRIKGGAKEGFGKAEEALGDLTDNPNTEAEGKKDQVEGNIQQGWGEAKDAARDVVNDDDSPDR